MTGPLASLSEQACGNPACGKMRRRLANGRLEGCHDFCWGCFRRWDRANRPDTVPPRMSHAERTAAATEANATARRERVEDFRLLTRFRGMTCAEAAAVLGVTVDTAWAYDRFLRGQVAA